MSHKPESDRPNISISQSANNSENVTQIGQAGDVHITNSGDVVHGDKVGGDKVGGDKISVGEGVSIVGGVIGSGSVEAENIAGGDITVGVSADVLKSLFEQLTGKVQELPPDKQKAGAHLVSKLEQQVKEIEKQGEQANETIAEIELGSTLNSLQSLAHDIWDVAVTTFQNPAKGFALVIQKIAAKARAQSAG